VPRGTKLERGKECTGLVRAFESARRPISPLKMLGSGIKIRLRKMPVPGRRESMARIINAATAAG